MCVYIRPAYQYSVYVCIAFLLYTNFLYMNYVYHWVYIRVFCISVDTLVLHTNILCTCVYHLFCIPIFCLCMYAILCVYKYSYTVDSRYLEVEGTR